MFCTTSLLLTTPPASPHRSLGSRAQVGCRNDAGGAWLVADQRLMSWSGSGVGWVRVGWGRLGWGRLGWVGLLGLVGLVGFLWLVGWSV